MTVLQVMLPNVSMRVAIMVTTDHIQNNDAEKRPHQKETRKLNDTCIPRIYVDYYNDGHVTVTHITAHTNHQPGGYVAIYPSLRV